MDRIQSKCDFPWKKFLEFYVRPQGDGNALAVDFLRSRGKVPEEAETSITMRSEWIQVYRLTEWELKELVRHLRKRDPEAFRYFGRQRSTEEVREFSFVDMLDIGERANYIAGIKRKKLALKQRPAAMTASHVVSPGVD